MRIRLPWVGAAALVAVASLAAGCAGARSSSFNYANSDFTPSTIRSYSGFPLYWVGTHFEGLPLTFINGPEGPDHLFTFTYGTCTPRSGNDDASCGPPLEIQIQPLCAHLDVVASKPVWRHRRVRGAAVGYIDAPVLFASRVQVKVYASSTKAALHVMHALRSANRVVPILGRQGPIPAAPVSELSGSQSCSSTPRIGN